MKFYKLLNKRLRSDSGSATLIAVVLSMAVFMLCLGFATDLTKNAYLKNIQNSQAQLSTDEAIKTVGANGSLLNFTKDTNGQIPDAIYSVISEYHDQNSSSYNSSIKGMSGNAAERQSYKFSNCTMGNIKKYGSTVRSPAKLPYMVITLDSGRSIGNTSNKIVYEVEGDGSPKLIDGKINTSLSYNVVSADIHDAVGNFILGMFGQPCQQLDSKVSSITFGSQSDLSNNN